MFFRQFLKMNSCDFVFLHKISLCSFICMFDSKHLWLLIFLSVFSSCDESTQQANETILSTSSEGQPKLSKENNQSELSSFEIANETAFAVNDDLNHDGIADSLVWNADTESLSVLWGKENGELSLFREWRLPLAEYDLGVNIKGDTLVFNTEGIEYCFMYRDDDFYLIRYRFFDFCCPSYTLDFVKNRMIFPIYEDLEEKNYETNHYPFIDIPKNISSNITLEDCFVKKKDLGIYFRYDDIFLLSKRDSFSKIISSGYLVEGTKYVNDENQLVISYEASDETNLFFFFDKKGVSKKIQLELESEMAYMMIDDLLGHPVEDIVGAFVKRQKTLLDDGYYGSKQETFSIVELCSDGVFTTFCLKRNSKEKYMTFNKIEEPFYGTFVDREKDELHKMLLDGLKVYFDVITDEELKEKLRVSSLDKIPYPNESPFIYDGALVYKYQKNEITYSEDESMPEARIPLDIALTFFKKEGRNFLNNIKEEH